MGVLKIGKLMNLKFNFFFFIIKKKVCVSRYSTGVMDDIIFENRLRTRDLIMSELRISLEMSLSCINDDINIYLVCDDRYHYRRLMRQKNTILRALEFYFTKKNEPF